MSCPQLKEFQLDVAFYQVIIMLCAWTELLSNLFLQNYAQTLVDADRTSLFLVDNRTSELYARIFDIGGSLEDSRSSNLQKEIR